MDDLVECGICRAALDRDIDANVRLHDHLERNPACKEEFQQLVSAWGSATWSKNMSGAA